MANNGEKRCSSACLAPDYQLPSLASDNTMSPQCKEVVKLLLTFRDMKIPTLNAGGLLCHLLNDSNKSPVQITTMVRLEQAKRNDQNIGGNLTTMLKTVFSRELKDS